MYHTARLIAVTVLIGATATATAAGDAAAGKAKSQACVACHGVDGNSANPQWPKLAGQVPGYIAKQLADFKSGARKGTVMPGMVAGLSEQDMADLDAYFAGQKIKPGVAADPKLVKQGKKVYRGGNFKTGVSACMSCHGPSGHGLPPNFPRVAGQHAAYTKQQLLDFKAGKRTNDDETMTRIAFRMSEQEIAAVAEYMQGLH